MLELSDIVSWEYVYEDTVYDIEVTGNHNYFLEDDILVHNSSKTFSTLQALILIAATSPIPLLISVVSESVPHLKRGVLRDSETILGDSLTEDIHNKSDHIYTLNKSKMEFFSIDNASKLRGGRRHILFMNEGNNAVKDAYDELSVRTSICTIVDFNPTAEFWLHDILRQRGITDFSKDAWVEVDVVVNGNHQKLKIAFIHSTYNDAKDKLPATIVAGIESRKDTDPNWFRVYGLGLIGSIEGLIHPNFETIDAWPNDNTPTVYGLDFGFNDPCALTRTKIYDDTLVSQELLYESGLTNQDLDKRFVACGLVRGKSEIIADNAEPKSIEELFRLGWNIKPTIKGKGSVVSGIQKINQYKQIWVKDSVNAIKEHRNYMWLKDKNGKILDEPAETGYEHLMDSRRYSVTYKTMGNKPVFAFEAEDAQKFYINWNKSGNKTTQYGALYLMPDNTLYCLYVMWDSIAEVLIAHAGTKYDMPIPEQVATDMIQKMQLRRFAVSKLIANSTLLSKGRSTAKLITQELRARNIGNTISKPSSFELYGSIAYLNTIFKSGGVIINSRLPECVAQVAGWTYKESGKELMDGFGYCEALCLVAGEIKKEMIRARRLMPPKDYTAVQSNKKEVIPQWQVV